MDATELAYKVITSMWKRLKQALNAQENDVDYWVQTTRGFSDLAAEYHDTEIKKFAEDLCIACLTLLEQERGDHHAD